MPHIRTTVASATEAQRLRDAWNANGFVVTVTGQPDGRFAIEATRRQDAPLCPYEDCHHYRMPAAEGCGCRDGECTE